MNIQDTLNSEKDRVDVAKSIIEFLIEKYAIRLTNNKDYGVIFEGMRISRWKPWQTINVERTALSKDRIYMIQQYADIAPRGGKFFECGVYNGGITRMFIEARWDCVAFDTFEGIKGSGESDLHNDGEYACDSEQSVLSYIADAEVIKGDVSKTILDRDDPVSIAHIDLDVEEPTYNAIKKIYDLLLKDGVIIVDDYGFSSAPGVKKACDRFTKGKHLYLPTGQMVIMK